MSFIDFSQTVRNAYRLSLTEYSGNDSVTAPQFKTWFYIYRNNTAEEDFKKILLEDFLVCSDDLDNCCELFNLFQCSQVEIKDIDRVDFNFDSPRTAEINDDSVHPTNSKDITQFEDLKNTEPKDDMGSIDGFDTLKSADEPEINQAVKDYDELNQEEKNKVSKFDKHVDDRQYVEVPVIKKEIKEDNFSEKKHLKKKLEKESEGPEKITLPLKKYMEDSMEIMEATENRNLVSRVSDKLKLFMVV